MRACRCSISPAYVPRAEEDRTKRLAARISAHWNISEEENRLYHMLYGTREGAARSTAACRCRMRQRGQNRHRI